MHGRLLLRMFLSGVNCIIGIVSFTYKLSMSEWKGYYVYCEIQYPMTFSSLFFNSAAAEGTISGQGSDEVGAFIIQGITRR